MVSTLLDEHFLVWGVDGGSPEGDHISNNFGIGGMMCVCILAASEQGQMNLIETCGCDATAEEII
jgi:hypothetical protein